jgi:hypothetical protein
MAYEEADAQIRQLKVKVEVKTGRKNSKDKNETLMSFNFFRFFRKLASLSQRENKK